MDDKPRAPPRPTMVNAALTNLPHLVQQDPGLLVTPEKQSSNTQKKMQDENMDPAPSQVPGVLQAETAAKKPTPALKPGVLTGTNADLIPTKLSTLINDPTLDVTPEKPTMHKGSKVNSAERDTKPQGGDEKAKSRHVRFDVPDTPQSTDISDEASHSQIDSNLSNDSVSGTKEKILKQPFHQRAALYAQRNPLADITTDSSLQESTDNTTASSETLTSASDESLFNQIARHIEGNAGSAIPDMQGKVIRGDPKFTQALPEVKVRTVRKTAPLKPKTTNAKTKGKIVDIVSQDKKGPTRATIDQMTRPKGSTEAKKPFLRKKAGLHRHEHSIRYKPDDPDEVNTLTEPTYNSTLSLGQELQELKVAEFDAKAVVKQKLEESESLRNYVAEKTAEATNIDPDEKLYQNLVSMDVPPDELTHANPTAWKRMKPKPYKPKDTTYPKPDILDFFDAEELYTEEPCLDFEDTQRPSEGPQLAPLEGIMSLYKRMQIWEGM